VRKVDTPDSMRGSYLGPSFSGTSIETPLKSLGAVYQVMEDQNMYEELAELLDGGKVIGWFQGRMEFGPRALGGRSIIGDPRSSQMQSVMNLKIKYRESFRPFAPSVRAEKVSDWFEQDLPSPYMLMVAPIQPDKRLELNEHDQSLFGIDKLNVARSQLPAITHVDYSARIQTVHEDTNPRYYRLLEAFENKTDCPVLINTSFNVRGEPIVCTPEDAYRCFMRTEMDYLVIENFLLSKSNQPEWQDDDQWKQEFELD
jgi:carbamoyltransferase